MQALSSNSQAVLLKLAGDSIQSWLDTQKLPFFETSLDELRQPAGCFVTLRSSGALRGCIGTFEASQALYQNVMRMAVSGAFEDFRFPPVKTDELPQIRIEISVLGPLVKMNSLGELEVGRHGVLIRYGVRTGTYLPEVAVSQGWSGEEFLRHCAREKAGLAPEELARADVFLYEVQKFSEKD